MTIKCSAEWREDDGETARCILDEGHAGVHQWRNVIAPPVRGWAMPLDSVLMHYFVSGASLCGRCTFTGELATRLTDAITLDDCVACTKKLAAQTRST